ncbi:GntR family transcriptional regulator [Nocardioides sp. zg-1228]|uniref:GntR family transcriptional regulator n=1 Tax=Nocardioides sp. zg-1228 TaxID=2763008 RepID=UPI001642E97B|nr:GntR family transcriptional regulator [Nocardioides sp. zg-1228]MBC2934639.1 GntR family transcriptional regulator [Nocardioides sp. zg-1228]QSF59384.1 GntR family transcriptional regulator [Nocardioides sp. zg-1228]
MSRRADQVLRALRADIVAGTHPAGTRLTESELCEAYDVSRVPVREALRHLEAEGFVTSVAYAGVRVAHLDSDEAADIFAVRSTIEELTARRAAERCRTHRDDDEVRRFADLLRELVAAGRSGLEAPGRTDLPPLNTRFHLAIAEFAGNASLLGLLRQIGGKVEWLYGMDVAARGEHSWQEHDEIAEAVLAGHPRKAAGLMRQHVHNSLDGYLRRHTR